MKNSATDIIAAQEWTKPAEETLQHAVESLFEAGGTAGKKAENFLHGTWLGHPLHPALVEIPLGAWSIAAVCDLLEVARGRRSTSQTADISIGLGLAAACVAAAAGMTDWHKTDGRARRLGMFHGVLNLGAMGLYGASLALRKRTRRPPAIALALLAYGVANASGWLGGHLAYRENIGADHATQLPLPPEFTPVMRAEELAENTPTLARVQGARVLLVRQGERIFAMSERCSHLGGPLSEGTIEDGCVRCPWHGSSFSIATGAVVDSPAVHPQPVYEAREMNGQIEVRERVGAPEQALSA